MPALRTLLPISLFIALTAGVHAQSAKPEILWQFEAGG